MEQQPGTPPPGQPPSAPVPENGQQHAGDTEIELVAAELRKLDTQGLRTAQVLRDTFDQLYDGQRTGRYKFDQLYKTEKTHCGTLVEINLQREFKFQDGVTLDYCIAGVEVDCKYSQTLGAWMIPPEAQGHLCLLLSAVDSKTPSWAMGLVRVTADRLNPGGNRDRKATLNAKGRESIVWLFQNTPLPPNVLLQLDPQQLARVMAAKKGQRRVVELFRVALGMRVGRAVVATVGEQVDYMRRIRFGGGARNALQREGIIILGQFGSHATFAQSLRIAVPGKGESVSVRVTPASVTGPGVAEISGGFWKVAAPDDAIVPAPVLPKIARRKASEGATS